MRASFIKQALFLVVCAAVFGNLIVCEGCQSCCQGSRAEQGEMFDNEATCEHAKAERVKNEQDSFDANSMNFGDFDFDALKNFKEFDPHYLEELKKLFSEGDFKDMLGSFSDEEHATNAHSDTFKEGEFGDEDFGDEDFMHDWSTGDSFMHEEA